jgi:hypothetical protein
MVAMALLGGGAGRCVNDAVSKQCSAVEAASLAGLVSNKPYRALTRAKMPVLFSLEQEISLISVHPARLQGREGAMAHARRAVIPQGMAA